MSQQRKPHLKPLSKSRIIRAIASSTAIETGQSIAEIELKLANKNSKFKSLKLAS
jgi:hypothetical protein